MPRYKFCAICGGSHDPDKPCNLADQALRDMGVPQKRGVSRKFNSVVRRANRSMLIILAVLGLILFMIFLAERIRRIIF